MAGPGQEAMNAVCKKVIPIMSTDYCQAHRRVIGLYRNFYRFIPYIVRYFDIPKTEQDCRMMIRHQFYKNACVTDIRVIDVLVIKGCMEYKEMKNNWQQKSHVMAHWHPSAEPQPYDFISKFLAGVD